MSYWEMLLLGVVQGITEFLPISSDGHLAILQAVLGKNLDSLAVTIALHVGTLGSILVVYARDLPRVLRQPRLCAAIVIATLPVVVVGLLLKDVFERVFAEPIWAGVGLCMTALWLALCRRVERGDRPLEQIRWQDALLIGVFQSIAPLPGVSRSGSTIFAGLLSGLSREAAANFSFLIAIPAISGATVLYAKKLLTGETSDTAAGPLVLGVVTAFLVGIVALRGLLVLVQRRRLAPFAWYCALLGIGTIVWQLAVR